MSPLQRYTTRVLRHWGVIVAITVVGALLSLAWGFTTGVRSWTATVALTTQSQTRAPDQDAVLALGYVDFFNQSSYQDVLRSEVSIPSGVKLTAKTGATSPILYIEGVGTDVDATRTAAQVAAERFREDVRGSLLAERKDASGDIQGQIDRYVQTLQEPGRTQAEINVILDQIRSMQGRLTDIQSDDTNLLKPLQTAPGTVETTPSKTVGIASGAVGGLVLGVLVALLMVVLDSRLRSAADIRHRLGLDTLAELRRRMSRAERARSIENLANALGPVTGGRGAVVAVVAAQRSYAASAFARELAIKGASRRSGTILVRADLRKNLLNEGPGLVDLIDGRASIFACTAIGPDGLAELPTGSLGGRDPYAVFEPRRFAWVIEQLSKSHGLVVIETPPLLEASESQVVCTVADHVIVVVERGVTRWTKAREAMALLGRVDAELTGVVIDDSTPEDAASAGPSRVAVKEQPADRQPVRVGTAPTGNGAVSAVSATVPVRPGDETAAMPLVEGADRAKD